MRLIRARDRIVASLSGPRVLAAGLTIFLLSFSLIPFRTGTWNRIDRLSLGPAMLLGRTEPGDIAQDMVGFRRLVERRDPYPVLRPALEEIGIRWAVEHRSTHPPTGYLVAAPIAYLVPQHAVVLWAALGYLMIWLSGVLYGLPWRTALGLSLGSCAWMPFSTSFQNYTLVWGLGLAVAFRFRRDASGWAGLGVGLAGLTKLLPFTLAIYFVAEKNVRAVLATLGVAAVAISLVLALEPTALQRYLAASRAGSGAIIARPDNVGLFSVAFGRAGVLGIAALVACFIAILYFNRDHLLRRGAQGAYAFMLYSYLAVALLPIAWCYSMAPLFPVLLFMILRGTAPQALLSTGLLVALAVQAPWVNPWLSVTLLLVGANFLWPPPAVNPPVRA